MIKIRELKFDFYNVIFLNELIKRELANNLSSFKGSAIKM